MNTVTNSRVNDNTIFFIFSSYFIMVNLLLACCFPT